MDNTSRGTQAPEQKEFGLMNVTRIQLEKLALFPDKHSLIVAKTSSISNSKAKSTSQSNENRLPMISDELLDLGWNKSQDALMIEMV